jgi:hypothetical protein
MLLIFKKLISEYKYSSTECFEEIEIYTIYASLCICVGSFFCELRRPFLYLKREQLEIKTTLYFYKSK